MTTTWYQTEQADRQSQALTENAGEMIAYRTGDRSAVRAQIRDRLAEIANREKERDAMAATVAGLQQELDLATQRHATATAAIQSELAQAIETPRRLELREQLNTLNDSLQQEANDLNRRIAAAQQELSYLNLRTANKSALLGNLLRAGDPALLEQIEVQKSAVNWATQRMKAGKVRLRKANDLLAMAKRERNAQEIQQLESSVRVWTLEVADAELQIATATAQSETLHQQIING